MSIFPTKVLLATDASAEAQLAATTAADLASSTNSELHVVHVGELRPTFLAQTEVEPAELEREAQRLLDEQVRRVEEAGGTVKEAHLRLTCRRRDRRLGPQLGYWVDSYRQQGAWEDEEGSDGQCLRFGGQARPLPGHNSQGVRGSATPEKTSLPRHCMNDVGRCIEGSERRSTYV